jgi:hypothetical protein
MKNKIITVPQRNVPPLKISPEKTISPFSIEGVIELPHCHRSHTHATAEYILHSASTILKFKEIVLITLSIADPDLDIHVNC